MSTIFALSKGDEEVARCLMTYHNSEAMEHGPTIEMIAVRQDERGNGWLSVLYAEVEKYALERWPMLGQRKNGEMCHRLFATYLTGTEVEIRAKSSGKRQSLRDKDFFFKYEGYEVRFCAQNQMISGRPADEEAVKYFTQLAGSSKAKNESAPSSRPKMTRDSCERGKVCHRCARPGARLTCSRCRLIHYCDAECQSEDWSMHKLWCCKTQEQVETRNGSSGYCAIGVDGVRVQGLHPGLMRPADSVNR